MTGCWLVCKVKAYWYYGYSKRGRPVSRMITPGSLTPLRDAPVYHHDNKLKRGRRGKYRHIASYSLAELLELNWDGSLYCSYTAGDLSVPFIPGYDSDSCDEYETIDIQRGKGEGIIGNDAKVGLYMSVPNAGENGEARLAQILKEQRGK